MDQSNRDASKQTSIITYLDQDRWPLLEMIAQPCNIPINEVDQSIIAQMDDLLNVIGDEALGLAASQIGYPKQIFMLRGRNGEGVNSVYINPTILSQSKEMKKDSEACLSLPGIGGFFKRPKSVTLQYYDHDHNLKVETFNGLYARCIMHEMNHLSGILITRHINQTQQSAKTKFNMNLTSKKLSDIKDRRVQNKKAKKARKLNRA